MLLALYNYTKNYERNTCRLKNVKTKMQLPLIEGVKYTIDYITQLSLFNDRLKKNSFKDLNISLRYK